MPNAAPTQHRRAVPLIERNPVVFWQTTTAVLALNELLALQGIDRLAPGLRVEARAPDGLIEAVSMPAAPGFVLGVQWHPEWRFNENPVSLRLFQAFREACIAYAVREGSRQE